MPYNSMFSVAMKPVNTPPSDNAAEKNARNLRVRLHFSKLYSGPCFYPASPKLRVQIADYHLRDTFEERPPALIRCTRRHQKRSHNYRMAVRPRQNPDIIECCGHAIQCVGGPAFVRETYPRRNSRPQSIGDRLVVEKIKEKLRRWRGKKLPLPEFLQETGRSVRRCSIPRVF